MKVGSANASRMNYVPMHDRLASQLLASASKAKREGRPEAVMMVKDTADLQKALEIVREYYPVETEHSNSVKVSIKL